MSTFVLIHGAFHGGWCWDALRVPLESAGHQVVTPDLPGLGGDTTPASEINPVSYTERVIEVVRTQSEPVVLVGHSMSGLMISEAAEQVPEKIAALVYIAAWLLPDGESSPNFYKELGVVSPVMACCEVDDIGMVSFKPEFLQEKLYNTTAPEIIADIGPRLRPILGATMAQRLALTSERYGSVRRIYIETLRDEAIPQKYQQMMYSVMPCEQVITIDSDHCPMVSRTDLLAEHLMAV